MPVDTSPLSSAARECRVTWAGALQAGDALLQVIAEHHGRPFCAGHLVGGSHATRTPGVQHALRRGMCASWAGCETLSERPPGVDEALCCDDSVDEPPGKQRLRRQDRGREDHL